MADDGDPKRLWQESWRSNREALTRNNPDTFVVSVGCVKASVACLLMVGFKVVKVFKGGGFVSKIFS